MCSCNGKTSHYDWFFITSNKVPMCPPLSGNTKCQTYIAKQINLTIEKKATLVKEWRSETTKLIILDLTLTMLETHKPNPPHLRMV